MVDRDFLPNPPSDFPGIEQFMQLRLFFGSFFEKVGK